MKPMCHYNMYTYFPTNTAHIQFIIDGDPNSVITKEPSAEVGVEGLASEFTRNSLPLDKAQATLFKTGKYSKAST